MQGVGGNLGGWGGGYGGEYRLYVEQGVERGRGAEGERQARA